VLVAVVLEAWAGRGSAPASARPTLLPDVGARPRVVAVNVNSARRATLRNASLVSNLVNGLPASTRFVVLTNDRSAFTLARNDRPDRVRFIELPFENPFTIWTQDPFLVLRDETGNTTLLTSRAFERADDRLMADAIVRQGGISSGIRASGLSFEGGNVVSDTEHVFIGANTIRRNAIELNVSEAEVVFRFEEELGRSILVIGPVPQPVGHIDMMLTPLGNGRIALADPAAGARLAQRALDQAPSSVEAFERDIEEHFFGDPSIREVKGVEGPISAPHVRGRTSEMIAGSWKVAAVLEGVARSLAERGYRVERIPLLFGGPDAGPPEADDERVLQAVYPMLTYNNVLIEDGPEGRVVYMPRYGWPAMDRAAEQAWQALGFATRPIDGLTISAMYGGALRCAVKVLAR
jgi:hypothetical protein